MSFASESESKAVRDVDAAQRRHAQGMVTRFLRYERESATGNAERYHITEYFKLQGVRSDLIEECIRKVEKSYATKTA